MSFIKHRNIISIRIPEGYKGRIENSNDGETFCGDDFVQGPAIMDYDLGNSPWKQVRFVIIITLSEKPSTF